MNGMTKDELRKRIEILEDRLENRDPDDAVQKTVTDLMRRAAESIDAAETLVRLFPESFAAK